MPGSLIGEEVMIDPEMQLQQVSLEVPLPTGVSLVIEDARRYLGRIS